MKHISLMVKEFSNNWRKAIHYIQKKSLFGALLGPKVWLAEIPPNMYEKFVENYFRRINACNISHGGYLNDVVFHT